MKNNSGGNRLSHQRATACRRKRNQYAWATCFQYLPCVLCFNTFPVPQYPQYRSQGPSASADICPPTMPLRYNFNFYVSEQMPKTFPSL